MFRYTGCGLRSVYLLNGYKERKTLYGKAVSVEDVEGLHKAIGTYLVSGKAELTGSEFRFLRKEMDMTQTRFGNFFDRQGQTVAIWEKKSTVPKYADFFIRFLYQEKIIRQSVKISEAIDHLNDLDRKRSLKIVFEETSDGWIPNAA